MSLLPCSAKTVTSRAMPPTSLHVAATFPSTQAHANCWQKSQATRSRGACFAPCAVAKRQRGASRVVVVDNVVEATNIGSIFRSAAALGIDAVLLTSNSCDPLTRRAVRVSMGSVFLVPWTWLEKPVQWLNTLGFKTVAMALTDKSVSVSDPVLTSEPRLVIVMGTEGDGLPHDTIADADYVARIPMSHNVDSLNVAAASAVAFWELRRR